MYKRYVKRVLDIVLSVLAAPVFLLVLAVTAPLIYFSDRGPVFFNAQRIGRDGRLFKMYKFRSMKVGAPDVRLEDGSTYNGEDDPRVTKVGKILRKTSIDELPQILNILKGDMSLIGPRPDPPDWLERYPEDMKSFLSVRPGITGYNQAYFRNASDGQEKMQNDVYYARHCSFGLDIRIFFKTIGTVLMRENTYKPEESTVDIKNLAAAGDDREKEKEIAETH